MPRCQTLLKLFQIGVCTAYPKVTFIKALPATSVKITNCCHDTKCARHASSAAMPSPSTKTPPVIDAAKPLSDVVSQTSTGRQRASSTVHIVKRVPRRPNIARRWDIFDPEEREQAAVFSTSSLNSSKQTQQHAPYGSLTVFATAEEYDLEKLEEWFINEGIFSRIDLPEELRAHAVHLESRFPVDEEPREIYVFKEGYAAFWNVQPNEIRTLLASFRRFETSSFDADLIRQESEHMHFTFHHKGVPKIDHARGLLCLEDGASHERNDLVKYVFSNATGLSAKLGVSESLVEKFTFTIEDIAEKLKAGSKINLSRRDVLRLSGEVFMFRHKLNLQSELATTPDVYWEHEWLENLYAEASRYFSIHQRVRVTNDALDYCREVVDLMREDLNNSYGHRLEILIILLIMIEVAFECAHFGKGYLDSKRSPQVVLANDGGK